MPQTSGKFQFFRQFSREWVAIGLLAVTGMVGVPACQHRELADWHAERRAKHLAQTAAWFVENEAIRPRKLAKALAFLERESEYRDQRWAALPGQIQALLDYEFAHWRRMKPRIAQEAARQLRGQPEDLEPTAIRLFY